jgi:hypothetical protein
MSVRFRPIDWRRTWVVQINSSSADQSSSYIWLAIQNRKRDWAAVFSSALNLLMETPEVTRDVPPDVPRDVQPQEVRFAEGAGRITWQRTWFWIIIRLQLNSFSPKKRALIAAALLKSARYTD